eukprot:2502704-Pleurochrysis_carterae.AAC.2
MLRECAHSRPTQDPEWARTSSDAQSHQPDARKHKCARNVAAQLSVRAVAPLARVASGPRRAPASFLRAACRRGRSRTRRRGVRRAARRPPLPDSQAHVAAGQPAGACVRTASCQRSARKAAATATWRQVRRWWWT